MDAIEKLIAKVAERFGADPHKFAGPARCLLAELGVSVPAETGRIEPVAYICILSTADAGPTKFFTSQSDSRGFPVFRAPPLPTKEGWQWVPVEPTPEMMQAGHQERTRSPTNMNPWHVWRTMLSAAPKP